MSIALPVAIFACWFALICAPSGQLAIEDARDKVPKEKRRGVSILPGFPVFPLMAWGLAVAIDRFIPPWGSWVSTGLHGLLLVISLFVIIRDFLRLRRMRE